jgi:aryl-alcohol dehydrogenase-like predicted oxidoreductase
MQLRPLGATGIAIAPVVFGGNVFGWTIDEATSFSVLDAFVDHGFNAIDTADVYSRWAAGNQGGESETILGKWLKARPSRRDQVVLFTKVGSDMGQGKRSLAADWIARAAEDSLRRLGVERIDLYFSHWPDPDTPHAETLGAYARLQAAGKVRAIGASNYSAQQLSDALAVARSQGLPAYQVLQPEYNLADRPSYEGPLRDLCVHEGLGVVTYYSLASGFLSGKYRSEADLAGSARSRGVAKYLNARGTAILKALDAVAEAHSATPAEVALAWLIAREGVTAPIASATSVRQVESFAKAAGLQLAAAEIAALDTASALQPA